MNTRSINAVLTKGAQIMRQREVLEAPERPLDGLLILDFSQFLAGPVCAMRLSDLGARVIKVERPGSGDIGRGLAFAGLSIDGDTLSFHVMNRGKESFAADLKDPDDHAEVMKLIAKADVIVQNFRPGVMERLGLSYEQVVKVNPSIIYASITGYGESGPWSSRPGQDLLAQSISGLPHLNGNSDDPPIAVGVALADVITSIHAAHGITAALLRRERTGKGAHVETSLLESMLDLQFELLSAHLTDESIVVKRGAPHTAHAFLQAPYGIYPTSDGHIALAMNSVPQIGKLIGLPELEEFSDPDTWWTAQSEITSLLAQKFPEQSTQFWLNILDHADIWCSPVLKLEELVNTDGFKALDMAQEITRSGVNGVGEVLIQTTRSPIRFDGKTLKSNRGAPRVGENTNEIRQTLLD